MTATNREQPSRIHVALASDKHLIRQLGTTALSATAHSSRPMHFHLFTPAEDAGDPSWQAVIAALAEQGATSTLTPVDLRRNLDLKDHLTIVTYYRLLLPHVLPDIDRLIYLDCDVLVGRDLGELWDVDLGTAALGGVQDVSYWDWEKSGLNPEDGYFNAGVLLLDLSRIRQERSFDSAMDYALENQERLAWDDQCALNVTFARQWHRLPSHWNYQYHAFSEDVRRLGMKRAKAMASASVFHFNNYDKPWRYESAHPLKREYSDVARGRTNLEIRPTSSLTLRWKRAKRALKWRLIEAGLQ